MAGATQRHRRRAPALELLQAAARRRLAAGQGELDLGLEVTEPAVRGAGGGPLPITAMRMGYLLDALEVAYRALGLADAAAGDEVFAQLVAAALSKATPTTAKPATPRTAPASPANWPPGRPSATRGNRISNDSPGQEHTKPDGAQLGCI